MTSPTTERTVSESVSEKRRRGRPPAFEPEHDAAMFPIWSDKITTKRSLRNKQFSVRGFQVTLVDGKCQDRYRWFAGNGKREYRQAVLVELGRIAVHHGDSVAREMADRVADGVATGDFTTTREAASWLRWARLSTSDKPTEPSVRALERLIITTVKNYLLDHPDATEEMAQEALWGAAERLAPNGT